MSNKPKALRAARSAQQVADYLGINIRTVQQTEQRAMRKIKAAIEKRAKQAKVTVWEWLFEERESC